MVHDGQYPKARGLYLNRYWVYGEIDFAHSPGWRELISNETFQYVLQFSFACPETRPILEGNPDNLAINSSLTKRKEACDNYLFLLHGTGYMSNQFSNIKKASFRIRDVRRRQHRPSLSAAYRRPFYRRCSSVSIFVGYLGPWNSYSI